MVPPPQIRLYNDEAIIDGFAGGGGASTGIEMALGMRMLTPRELFLCQGFPASYEIDHVPSGPITDLFGTKGLQKLTKKAQTRLVGNSVPPHVAAAIVSANAVPQIEAVA